MGRLAGFRYREVAQRLRVFGFRFDLPARAAMKCGVIHKQAGKSRFRITLAIWRKERCERFYAMLGLM